MDLRALRILIVEDHPRIVEILRSVLSGLGATHVRHANSATQAQARLKAEYFDLLIVDQKLQGESGLDIVRKVRLGMAGAPSYIAILMLTASGDRKTVAAARDAGVTEFLVKPFTAAGLAKRLQLMIDWPRPFIRSADYAGPDRRRRANPAYSGLERRKNTGPQGPVQRLIGAETLTG